MPATGLFLFIILFAHLHLSEAKTKNAPGLRNPKCNISKFERATVNYRAWREQFVICKLLANYESSVRPLGTTNDTGPVHVLTSLALRSISAVSDADMEYIAQFRFQQEWFDYRLGFANVELFRTFDTVQLAKDQSIWIPDTFFQNEKNGWYHMLDQPNKFTKIRSDGKIIYNRRLTLTLACNLNLLKYPLDTQTCLIDFASYAYTTTDIVYIWDDDAIIIHPEAAAVLPNFVMKTFKNATCDSVTNTGTYSCLRVEFRLERVFSFFLLQLYVPSSMLVAVSWVSYWIDWKSTAARVPLAIVTLLTMITQSHAVNSNLPPVSYTKAIDVWIGACVMFIFASLIEYAVVNYIGINEEHKQMRRRTEQHRKFSTITGQEMVPKAKASVTSLTHNITVSPSSVQSSPSIGAASPEKTALLRRRGTGRNRRRFYVAEQEEPKDDDESATATPTTSSSRHVTITEPDWKELPATDWIQLNKSRNVELVRWCSVFHNKGRAERIDMIARVVVPVAFTMFNIAYWTAYLAMP